MYYSFKGCKPVVLGTHTFVHPQATVIGSVVIGDHVYIGPQCVIRGDFGSIQIHNGSNVQECCVIHSFPGMDVILEKNVHIGHGAIIHGAHIEENCLIGMNAVIMDNVRIGKESIIGALSFVKTDEVIPPRSLVVGNPARVIKSVTDEMIQWKTQGTEIYQRTAQDCLDTMVSCLPLSSVDDQQPLPDMQYENWNLTKKK